MAMDKRASDYWIWHANTKRIWSQLKDATLIGSHGRHGKTDTALRWARPAIHKFTLCTCYCTKGSRKFSIIVEGATGRSGGFQGNGLNQWAVGPLNTGPGDLNPSR